MKVHTLAQIQFEIEHSMNTPSAKKLFDELRMLLPQSISAEFRPYHYAGLLDFNPIQLTEGMIYGIRNALDAEDYQTLQRDFGDIENISHGELFYVGKPLGIGGGGPEFAEIILSLVEADNAVIIAAITSVTAIFKQFIASAYARNKQCTVRLKYGNVEIEVTGKDDRTVDQIVENYFSKLVRQQILVNDD